MENQNQNIENLFREAFSGYEENVKPELWNKISHQLDVTSVPGAESAGSGAGASVASGAIKWVAIAAVTAATSVGVYFLTTDKTSTPPAADVVLQVESGTTIQTESQPAESAQENVSESMHSADGETEGPTHVQHLPSPLNQVSGQHSNEAVSADQNKNSAPGTISSAPVKSVQPQSESVNSGHSNSGTVGNASPVKDRPSGSINQLKINADKVSGVAPLMVRFTAGGEVNQVEWEFGDGSFERNGSSLTHTFDQPGEYQVTAKSSDGNLTRTDKITIQVTENLDIRDIPNIFTPNGDGMNDVFRFESSKFAEIEVVIFDQNGNQVARITDPAAGWDGSLKTGAEAKDGTYLYTIFATSSEGLKHQQKGWFRLIRQK